MSKSKFEPTLDQAIIAIDETKRKVRDARERLKQLHDGLVKLELNKTAKEIADILELLQ